MAADLDTGIRQLGIVPKPLCRILAENSIRKLPDHDDRMFPDLEAGDR